MPLIRLEDLEIDQQELPVVDLSQMKQDVIDEMGQEWWDRYGEASLRAALVVSGTVPAGIVIMFDTLAAM